MRSFNTKSILFVMLFLFSLNGFNQENKQGTIVVRNQTNDSIIVNPDINAEFPGGIEAMYKYLSQTISYPDSLDFRREIQGKVFVGFVVEVDGSITNIEVLRSMGIRFDEVVVNAIKKMPKWNPGKTRGSAVRVKYVLPVNFDLK